MDIDLNSNAWVLTDNNIDNASCCCSNDNGSLYLENQNKIEAVFTLSKTYKIKNLNTKQISIKLTGEQLEGAGCCLYMNGYPVPLNSTINMSITVPILINYKIVVRSVSKVKVTSIKMVEHDGSNSLLDSFISDSDVLVLSPAYPSSENLYLCGFAHSRVREYVKNGLKVDVACIDDSYWYQTTYNIDNVHVFKSDFSDLKLLLTNKKYKTIIVHFSSSKIFQVFDGYITTQQLIFICHGADTLFEDMPKAARPYFVRPPKALTVNTQLEFAFWRKYLIKYSQMKNATFVFVSEWLKKRSEQLLNIKFTNSYVIHNLINEDLFPYKEKTADMRKKILIIRKFDNVSYHSIDQSVFAILELSRKSFFKELEFNIYGDGNYFDELLEPIKDFKNVNIYRTFIPNDKISDLHQQNGIMLLPSRYDTQGVSMGEAAMSGLVVVGSNVTSNGDFMNIEKNHTLADPEDPIELAGIIERLYYNPDEFLEISKRMSSEISQRCNKKQTVTREITLIKNKNEVYSAEFNLKVQSPVDEPILTIVIPAYNIEPYIHKCMFSLLNHNLVHLTEIIIVDDGSKDNTATLAKEYEKEYKGIIRAIIKENGGHGSTINVGIQEARGKYFRLIDGDDWVDSNALEQQVQRLLNETVDVVITDASFEYTNKPDFAPVISYENLRDDVSYIFDDLTFEHYGFKTYGPILSTSTYKTSCLKSAGFKISEKSVYVDMEFNAFSLVNVNTIKYYELDIYRYLIGREGQTVSKTVWSKKYNEHLTIIYNIINFVTTNKNLTERKRIYIIDHIICAMIDSQIFMFDQLCKWHELGDFLKNLKLHSEIYNRCINKIVSKDLDCSIILSKYRSKLNLKNRNSNPIINANNAKTDRSLGYNEEINTETFPNIFNYISAKKVLKALLPYGLIRYYQVTKYKKK